MTKRIFSFTLLIWILGFAWFAFLLPQPAGKQKTDAVVVLTGGANRIDQGLVVLEEGSAARLLISGVDRDVKPDELSAQYPGYTKQFACCVDLGFRGSRHCLLILRRASVPSNRLSSCCTAQNRYCGCEVKRFFCALHNKRARA